MGFIDWLIVIILALTAFHGFRKGLAAMLVRLGGAIAVFLLIGQVFPLVRNSLIVNLKLGLTSATLLGVILIIVAVAVVLGLLERIFHKALKATHLSGLNKLLGLLLGLANGILLVIIMMVLLDYAPKLSEPLKDGEKHRIYAAADVLKEEAFNALKFNERDRFQQLKQKIQKDKDKPEQGE